MLDLPDGNGRTQNGDRLTRRDVVRAGALGALGLSLPGFLAARTRAESLPSPRTAAARSSPPAVAAAPRAKSVLLVFLGGGMSHVDTFDVKPGAAEEVRGKYASIPTSVTGLRVGELLPRTARTMDKVCLVRSQCHESGHHEAATNWVLSGRPGSPFGDHPSVGSVVAHETGSAGRPLPPYVAVPRNPSFNWDLGTSAWLGERYESLAAGDPNGEASLVARPAIAESMAALSGEARSAFDIDAEPSDLRDRYGRSEFGQGCLLARRLIERGVRFAQVNFGGWDHHADIWSGLEAKCPAFDAGFSTLIQDMYDRGLLAETLVVCASEFGRSPRVNHDAGRDHWCRAGSMLFAGAGVQGGRVIGATDKNGAEVTDRPCGPSDVAWTVYDALGIDPRKQLQTPDGRAVEILADGAPVSELYA